MNVNWIISRDYRELAVSGYGQNSVVYACLSLLSTSVPEPPLIPYVEHGEKDLEPLPPTHALRLLLKRPNPFMSQTEFWELITLYMGITGRAHFFKERDRLGNVIALWPLRPDRVGPIYLPETTDPYAPLPLPPTGPGQHVLWGWAYWPPGLGIPVRVPAKDVAHFKWADPAGETGGLIEGMGPLQVLNREVEADNEATTFVGSLLKNSAIPGILLKTKSNIDRQTADRIKRIFASQFGGAKRGEPAVVDGDTDVEQVAFNLSELEFPDLRAISESRISAAFGVPAVLAGLKVGLDHATYSNLQQAREFFAETTLATMWQRLADQFTQDIASEFGADIVCAFDTSVVKALAGQREREKAPFVEAFKLGTITVNELREKVLGLPPLEMGGDVLYLPPRAIAVAVSGGGLTPLLEHYIEGDLVSPDTPDEPDDEAEFGGESAADGEPGEVVAGGAEPGAGGEQNGAGGGKARRLLPRKAPGDDDAGDGPTDGADGTGGGSTVQQHRDKNGHERRRVGADDGRGVDAQGHRRGQRGPGDGGAAAGG